MKILLSGGGTMGSVSPLLAVYQKIKEKNPHSDFLFVGSNTGPEKEAVSGYKIAFKSIIACRLRRYFNWRFFLIPFQLVVAFCQSFLIILKYKPDAVLIAGSFVGVPVAWAAWILKKPVVIHQQDILPGLANKLMANFAKKITLSFDVSQKDFSAKKSVLTGNAIRQEMLGCDLHKSRRFFNLSENLPIVLILGGGTGAKKINQIVASAISELCQFCQVIHITGKGKSISVKSNNYQQYEFLSNEMSEALCCADMVVGRAGMSTLSELSVLKKPSVIIPIPNSHQENNARYFQKNNAVVVLSQTNLNKNILIDTIKEILNDSGLKRNLSRNIGKMMKDNGADNISSVVLEMIKSKG